MAISSLWLLKIMSGPHAGAEVALQDGEWIVGRSEECDIVLNDVLLAKKHFKFIVEGERLEVEKLDGKVLLEGKLLEGERGEIGSFKVVSAGSTHFVVGEAEATWPELSEMNIPGQAMAGALGSNGTQEEESSRRGDSRKIPVGRATQVPPAKRRQHLILAVFGLLVLIVSVVIGFYVLPAPGVKIPPLEQELREILAGFTGNENLELENHEGQWIIRGYLKTLSQRRDLIRETNRLGGAVVVRVWSYEGMVDDAKNLLRALHMNMDVTAQDAGLVRVRGFVADMGDWEKAAAHLKEDVPGLKKLEDLQVIRQDQALATANQVLAELGLAGDVQLIPEKGTFVARGQVSDGTLEAWKELPARLERSLGFPVTINTLVRLPEKEKGEAAAPSGDDNKIASIIVGEMSWVTLRDGAKFFVGATLPTGGSIESIKPESVLVRKDGVLQSFKIGEALWVKP